MSEHQLPWFIHTLKRVYDPSVSTIVSGTRVLAVAEPYTAGRIKAAWWVLTGRAYAFWWPEAGELEDAVLYHMPIDDQSAYVDSQTKVVSPTK